MIAEDGTIEGMTMGISQELQIPEGLIEQKELCMGDLCAEFQEIMEVFSKYNDDLTEKDDEIFKYRGYVAQKKVKNKNKMCIKRAAQNRDLLTFKCRVNIDKRRETANSV